LLVSNLCTLSNGVGRDGFLWDKVECVNEALAGGRLFADAELAEDHIEEVLRSGFCRTISPMALTAMRRSIATSSIVSFRAQRLSAAAGRGLARAQRFWWRS